jgi:hypothetical protein
MKHWRIEQVGWDRFDPAKLNPEVVPLVKAAAMVERNGDDYAVYLKRVFSDDPDFPARRRRVGGGGGAARRRARAAGPCLADPAWDYRAAFERYRAGYKINTEVDASIRAAARAS